MTDNIYSDISSRTQGDIYIGVVGPVRTGKSTFIKRFMDTLVIPNIEGDFQKERAKDELPQSAAGRTIMTTEPKFIPEESIEISMQDNLRLKVRMIDCVGYIVPSSEGYIEDEQPRMVMTPWYEEEIPFNMAAEIGTKKVIEEHSTIGLVVTTDGSISQIPREEYEEAEERVINELKELGKPFVVLMNTTAPDSQDVKNLAVQMTDKYDVPVIPLNILEIGEDDIKKILQNVLYEFPVTSIGIDLPNWFGSLEADDSLRREIIAQIKDECASVSTMRSVVGFAYNIGQNENIISSVVTDADLSDGKVVVNIDVDNAHLFEIMSEKCGVEIADEEALLREFVALAQVKEKYQRIADALEQVNSTGYGIVMPVMDELSLEEPEIMKQGGKYGVRLKAQAPSIHMIKCNTYTEVAPIVGSESQSEELVMYLLGEFENNPAEIWNTNIFGKSLHSLVSEGLNNKLYRMPQDARDKFRETIERVINEGCSGLICIIL
ncbi:MAG: stage IV sporulation protein A [Eubacterium sp.]|nr:stage IV sporulation protein A [Eubacterium sp.]MBR0413309.1 stage IV sporulation protein A [Eubacterium sp.]